MTAGPAPLALAPAMADALARWLDDPAGRVAAGAAARAHVAARHGIEAEARAIVGVYRRLLGEAGAR